MADRDYMHEEWLAWQDVCDELVRLGISRSLLNYKGTALVSALRYWTLAHARLATFNEARDRAQVTGSDLKAMADWQNTGKDGRVL